MSPAANGGEVPVHLNEEQQRIALNLAREAIRAFFESEKEAPIPHHDFLQIPCGAFVTLKIDEELRGCIGITEPRFPLGETIVRCAISAAFQDPRFSALRKEEFNLIHLEISLLSSFREIKNIEEIVIGTHGLFISLGRYRGLLLPQVATENHWDREEFLSYTCRKAGLPTDSWRHEEIKIQIFSAQVFGEEG